MSAIPQKIWKSIYKMLQSSKAIHLQGVIIDNKSYILNTLATSLNSHVFSLKSWTSTLQFQNLIIQHCSEEVLEFGFFASKLLSKILGRDSEFVVLARFRS